MNEATTVRMMLVGCAADSLAAFAPHCGAADIIVPDLAAAQELLHGSSAPQGRRALRPRLIVLEIAAGESAAALVSALKADAHIRTLPLVVLCPAAASDACYHAGANACVVKPAVSAALKGVVDSIAGFWLGANEFPAGE